jgi:serine/threonine protein phosphatase PrpC
MGCTESKEGSSNSKPELDENGNLLPSEVAKRRTKAKISDVPVVKNYNGDKNAMLVMDIATCSQRGWYPSDVHKPNQDSHGISIFTSTPSNGQKDAQVANDVYLAIYDGHGPAGEKFARYAKKNLPELIQKYLKEARLKRDGKNEILGSADYEKALRKAHLECNDTMINTMRDVHLSGTTAIGVTIHDGNLIISNVGDSRAIIGCQDPEDSNSTVNAKPLSQDQTPEREDEHFRVTKYGGKIMSMEEVMMGGTNDMIKEGEDRSPLRVWLNYRHLAGVAFTRSLGDAIAEKSGVNGEPETHVKPILDEDKILVLASDGVFEFIENQAVIDLCVESKNPEDACAKVVDLAYQQWLENDERTDDITVIVGFLRKVEGSEELDES